MTSVERSEHPLKLLSEVLEKFVLELETARRKGIQGRGHGVSKFNSRKTGVNSEVYLIENRKLASVLSSCKTSCATFVVSC